jgi:hypothetical protein
LPSTSSGSRDIFSLHFTVSLYASKKQTLAPRQVISIRVKDWASLSRPIQILIRRRNRFYAFPKMMSILDFKQKVLAVNNLFNTDHLSLASTPLSSRWTAPLKLLLDDFSPSGGSQPGLEDGLAELSELSPCT